MVRMGLPARLKSSHSSNHVASSNTSNVPSRATSPRPGQGDHRRMGDHRNMNLVLRVKVIKVGQER